MKNYDKKASRYIRCIENNINGISKQYIPLYLQWKRKKPIYRELIKTIIMKKNLNLFTVHYKGRKMKHNIIYTKGETYLQIFCENNLDNCD